RLVELHDTAALGTFFNCQGNLHGRKTPLLGVLAGAVHTDGPTVLFLHTDRAKDRATLLTEFGGLHRLVPRAHAVGLESRPWLLFIDCWRIGHALAWLRGVYFPRLDAGVKRFSPQARPARRRSAS